MDSEPQVLSGFSENDIDAVFLVFQKNTKKRGKEENTQAKTCRG